MTNYDILKEYEAHKTPVPSYEEWRDLQDDLATCDKDSNNVCEQKEELYEENQQLKELLKECKPYISYGVNKKKYLGFTPPEANILTKIDNAIGEKK